MTFECAEEVRLELLISCRMDFGEGPAKVPGYGDIVHLGQPFVDADVAEIAVEKAEANGRAVVDGMELGEALSGKGLETQGHGGVGGGCIEGMGMGFCLRGGWEALQREWACRRSNPGQGRSRARGACRRELYLQCPRRR